MTKLIITSGARADPGDNYMLKVNSINSGTISGSVNYKETRATSMKLLWHLYC